MDLPIKATICGWNSLSAKHPIAGAYGVSDEEAREHLYRQREAIIDPDARRIIDFILGRDDAAIVYIGGDTAHVTAKGERVTGTSSTGENGTLIELATSSSPEALLHEAIHCAMGIVYRNANKPYASTSDKKLFVQALRLDTKASGMAKSGLRADLGISQKLYEYKDFAAEIPAYIIQAKTEGHWTQALAEKYPHLTAYVEKIILPDIDLMAKGHKNRITRRPDSIEELVSPDWQPAGFLPASGAGVGSVR